MSAPLSRAEAVALLDANSITRRSTQAVFLQYVRYLNDENLDENGDPIAWPKAQTIADKIGYCLRSVRAAIAELTAAGLIGRTAKKVSDTVRHGRAVVRSIVLSAFNRNAPDAPGEAPAKGAKNAPSNVQNVHPESTRSSYKGTTHTQTRAATPPEWMGIPSQQEADDELDAWLRNPDRHQPYRTNQQELDDELKAWMEGGYR